MKENDYIDKFIVITRGSCEFCINLEGMDFVIERMYQGAHFNLFLALIKARSSFTIRACEPTQVYFLTLDKIRDLRENNDEIDLALTRYEFVKIRKDNYFQVNIGHFLTKDNQHLKGEIKRENILKNIVLSIIIKNRLKKQM